MPVGLQIWDAAGTLVLDTTRRAGSIIGQVDVAVGGGVNMSGQVANSDFSRGTPFFYIAQYPWEDTFNSAIDVAVSISGTTLTWQVADNQYGSNSQIYGRVRILYGYY